LGGTGVPVGVDKKMKPERSNVEFATAGRMARDGPTSLGSIAGYGGHIQGKVAENIHSSTVQRANDLASVTRNRTPAWNQTPIKDTVKADHLADRSTPTGPGVATSCESSWRMQQFGEDGPGYSHCVTVPTQKTKYIDIKGSEIPGYQGYIPGRVPENVYGQAEARTNRVAQDRRQIPAYTPVKEGCGFAAQTAPAFWHQGADYPTIRNSMVAWRRNSIRSDVLPHFTEKERRSCVRGKLHETMGFKHGSAPSIPRAQFMWNKPKIRDSYEREISYDPGEEYPPGRVDPLEVAKRKGAAGEPSHTVKMDQMRQKLEYLQRNPDREMGTRT
jgi:hypothetical protein